MRKSTRLRTLIHELYHAYAEKHGLPNTEKEAYKCERETFNQLKGKQPDYEI